MKSFCSTKDSFAKKGLSIFSNKSINRSFANGKFTIDLPKWEGIEFDMKSLPTQVETTSEELMGYFRQLTTMRRMEQINFDLYRQKEIRGFCHLYIGQEAIAVGMEAAITKKDCIITGYREHCNFMARGDTPYRIIAEMMSRSTGSTQGKGGSMHYYSKKNNFYGGHGIVGAQIALGTGIAFALKYENKPNVCFAIYGDGCSEQGQLYEASNMAALWKLPVVYTIENNHFAMGTAEGRHSHYKPLHAKFRGFAGIMAKGENVFAVREAVKATKEYALKNGPIFLEIDTYRFVGHSMSDPETTYRTKDEVAHERETRDCIPNLKNYILGFKVASENDLKNIDKEIKEKILEDVEKIKQDPYPEPSELYTHVFVGENPPFIRGCEYPKSIFGEHKL